MQETHALLADYLVYIYIYIYIYKYISFFLYIIKKTKFIIYINTTLLLLEYRNVRFTMWFRTETQGCMTSLGLPPGIMITLKPRCNFYTHTHIYIYYINIIHDTNWITPPVLGNNRTIFLCLQASHKNGYAEWTL